MSEIQNQPETVTWDWHSFFSDLFMRQGISDEENDSLQDFVCDQNGRWAQAVTRHGFVVKVLKAPASYVEYLEYPGWDTLNTPGFTGSVSDYYSCSCAMGIKGIRCRHLVNLLLHWEKEHGPFTFTVDPELKKKYDAKKLQEKRDYIRSTGGISKAHEYVSSFLDPMPAYVNFQMDNALRRANLLTNMSDLSEAEKMLDVYQKWFMWSFGYTRNNIQGIKATWQNNVRNTTIIISQSEILEMSCNCGAMRLFSTSDWYYRRQYPAQICPHAMALYLWLRQRVLENNPGDRTDNQAQRLMDLLSDTVQNELTEIVSEENLPVPIVKHPSVDITPRIVNDGCLRLFFDLAVNGAKPLLIKNFHDLVNAVENETEYSLGKSVSPNFSFMTFTEQTQKWYQMVSDRVHIIRLIKKQMENGRSYYSSSLTAGNSFRLEGRDLDDLYDLAEGSSILYQYDRRNNVRTLRVGEASPKANITVNPLKADGRLVGVVIDGVIPQVFRGAKYQYILDHQFFARVAEDSYRYIIPFQQIAEKSTGAFKCILGENKFTEFAYRVLPALRASGQVNLTDNVSMLLDPFLPPEPEFTFYIDLVESRMTCKATVQYGDSAPLSLCFSAPHQPSDEAQEKTCHPNRIKLFSSVGS